MKRSPADPRRTPGRSLVFKEGTTRSLGQVGREEQGALCAFSQTEGHEGPCIPPFPACV